MNIKTKKPLKKPLLKSIWAIGIASVIVLSTLPAGQFPEVGDFSDKIKHFLAYAAIGGFGIFAASTDKRRLLVAAATIALGLGLEGVQYFLPTRAFEILDGVANTLGVLSALGAYYLYSFMREKFGR